MPDIFVACLRFDCATAAALTNFATACAIVDDASTIVDATSRLEKMYILIN